MYEPTTAPREGQYLWNRVRQKTELIKMLKEVYRAPPNLEPYQGSRVTCRSTYSYKSQDTQRTFGEKHVALQFGLQCGHFCPSHETYRSLGEPVTDDNDLVIQTLQDFLPENLPSDFSKQHTGAIQLRERQGDGPMEAEKPAESDDVMSDIQSRSQSCRSAGMDEIRRLVRESEKRMVANRAGQPYAKHLRKCQLDREEDRQRQAQEQNGAGHMVIKRLSSEMLLNHKVDAKPPRTSVCDEAPSNIRRKLTLRSVGQTILLKKKLTAMPEEVGSQRSRRFFAFRQKLENLYTVLCSLQNLRSRHLKSKLPLDKDLVQGLRRDPFATAKTDALNGTGLLKGRVSLRAPVAPSNDMLTSRVEVNSSIMSGSVAGRSSGTAKRTGKSAEEDAKLQSKLFAERGGLRRRTRNIITLMAMGDDSTHTSVVETYEDLCNLGKGKILKLMRKLPPWQRQMTTGDGGTPIRAAKSKKSDTQDDTSTDADAYHTEQTVKRLQLDMLKYREKTNKSAVADVEKIEREQMIKSRYQLASFGDLHPLYERHRKLLSAINREATKDPVLVMEESADWYDSLLRESVTLGLDNDPDTIHGFSKLEKFVHVNPALIVNVKEKLCLYCLSLPVHVICNPYMQTVIKFVLEEILESNVSLLESWLTERNLYVL